MNNILEKTNNNLFLTINTLHYFPANCINRDDINAIKKISMGGVDRQRISSSCKKHAIREYLRDNNVDLAFRSRKYPQYISNFILEQNKDFEAVDEAVDMILKLDNIKSNKDTAKDVIISLSIPQMRNLSEIAIPCYEELTALAKKIKDEEDDNKKKELKKKLTAAEKKYKDKIQEIMTKDYTFDQAMFGRMIAANHEYGIDASCQIAPPFSTHEMEKEIDFFTATDDAGDSSGSAHMNSTELTASNMYSFSCVDLKHLANTMAGMISKEDFLDTLRKTIEAMILAVPKGKINSCAHQTMPNTIYIELTTNNAYSLADAFEKPVEQEDCVEKSIDRLADRIERKNKRFKNNAVGVYGFTLENNEKFMSIVDDDNIDTLLDRLMEDIKKAIGV